MNFLITAVFIFCGALNAAEFDDSDGCDPGFKMLEGRCAQIIYPKEETIDFEGAQIEGSLKRPTGIYLNSLKPSQWDCDPYAQGMTPEKFRACLEQKTQEPQQESTSLIDLIKDNIKLTKKKGYYQIVFLIDASGSMIDDIQELHNKFDLIMAYAAQQLNEDGLVSFGVRYYVDQYSIRALNLDSLDTLSIKNHSMQTKNPNQQEMDEAKAALGRAINHIATIAGGWEYHWEESVKAIQEEPWSDSPDVAKLILILTDEPGDVRRYNPAEAIVVAADKRIRLRKVWIPDADDIDSLLRFTP